MPNIIVLGAGRVGKVIARDLAEEPDYTVTVSDRRGSFLEKLGNQIGCETICADLSDKRTIMQTVKGFDLAVDALPGAMGLATMESIIEAGVPAIDISFMPEDPFVLDQKAQEKGVPVVFDFGVAPGMSNLLAAWGVRRLAPARHLSIMVGGLPYVRHQPWEYVAPFSPADIIEEYVRPARVVINGEVVVRPALSGVELMDFPSIGTLEAFHTDGLRSLVHTTNCPTMEEKTLRYPGYADRINLLRQAGFLSTEPVEVEGVMVKPRELTLKLLEAPWTLTDEMDEFTVMRITVLGGKEPNYPRITWNLFDQTDRKRHETSMARTTAFPGAILARQFLSGGLEIPPGVHPPEFFSDNQTFVDILLGELNSRGVHYALSENLCR